MKSGKKIFIFTIILLSFLFSEVLLSKHAKKYRRVKSKWKDCGSICISSIFKNDFTNLKIPPIKGHLMDIAAHGKYIYLLVGNFNLIRDVIFQINRVTGKTKFIWGIGNHNAAAISCNRNYLWVLSRSKKYFLRKLSLTGKGISAAGIKAMPKGKIFGLAVSNGNSYLTSHIDGKSDIYRFNHKTGNLKKIFSFKEKIFSITFFKGNLYAYQKNFDTYAGHWLLIIDLKSGLNKKMRFPNSIARGLANNGKNLYMMERKKSGAAVFPVAVLKKKNIILANPAIKRIKIIFPAHNRNSNPYTADLWIAYPKNRDFQNIRNVSLKPKPKDIVTDRFGNRWAHIIWGNASGDVRATLKFDILIPKAAHTIDKDYLHSKKDIPPAIQSSSLRETYCFDISSYIIKSHSSNITMSGSSIRRIMAIRDYVNSSIRAKGPGPTNWSRASIFLYKGNGRCYGHTVSFAAIARHFGIPTRAVGGLYIESPKGKSPKDKSKECEHTWNQVYLPGTGWFDVDTVKDNNGEVKDTNNYIGYRPNIYFITFEGDYDKKDYRKIFAQRGWYRVYKWSSLNSKKKADLRFGRIEIKSVDLKK